MSKKIINDKQRFIDRIGKRIYRDHICDCPSCTEIDETWLIIEDKMQAIYLYDLQNDYGCEWIYINYRDEK